MNSSTKSHAHVLAGFLRSKNTKKLAVCGQDGEVVAFQQGAATGTGKSGSRIFSNLRNNAIKYSDGDLNITLNDTGEITFSNTASDLSEVDVKKLFDRFYTVENARKSTGLGLSISRILIEQMKGTISAQYKNGKLSICIWLPDVSGD